MMALLCHISAINGSYNVGRDGMMAESDTESKLDEMERDNLQKSISEVETALAVATPASRAILENFLQNARGRVGVLDKKIKDSQTAKEEHAREAAAVVADLAKKETALNERERETYSGFLSKEFFTKKDFGNLEQFYEKTWDRLSESGKDEMSHRVWEGVRRDEYKFTDLPKTVQEKESGRAYTLLTRRQTGLGNEPRIPESDRNDFVHAFESGNREEASRILERKSFRDNMALGTSPKIERFDVERRIEADRKAMVATSSVNQSTGTAEKSTPPPGSMAEIDLASINLDGLKVKDGNSATKAPAVANIGDSRSHIR